MQRRHSLVAFAAMLFAIACLDRTITGPTDTTIRSNISDAVHNGGRTHFYFLPPMVAAPSYSGTFDATLSPVVDVCPSNGSVCTDSAVATFSTTAGTGSELVRVSPTDQQYIVNWHTDAPNISAGQIYRIRVRVNANVVGSADVRVIANASEAKNVSTGEYIPLVDGKTLPVKFRIEQGMPVSLSVLPNPLSVIVGKTATLTATARDAHDQVLPNQPVSWSTSGTSIATVSSAGVVSGIAAGNETVTATTEGISASAVVNVIPPPVASVNVLPASQSVVIGKSSTLTTTLRDADGNVLTGRQTTWTSSDENVATVDGSGKVLGKALGQVTITASSEGKSGTAQVTVTQAPVAAVDVTPSSSTIFAGNTVQLSATLKDADGNILTGRVVTWSASGSSASVSSTGLVLGSQPGTSSITATSEGVNGTASVSVSAQNELDPLPGFTQSAALAVNNADVIVGWSEGSGIRRATLWKNGSTIDLGTLPGGTRSEALAINDAGQIVGYSNGAGFQTHAVAWSSTAPYSITDLGTFPTGATSVARGISNSGVVVGGGFTQIDQYPAGDHAFADTLGVSNSLRDIGIDFPGIFGILTTTGTAVSDNGTIVGTAIAYWTNEPWGWIRYPSNPTLQRPLGLQDANSSFALAINGSGQMAGVSRVNCPQFLCDVAVYWPSTATQAIALVDFSTVAASRATAINSSSDVVGYIVSAGAKRGRYWAGGAPGGTELQPLANSVETVPQGINSGRLVVGYANVQQPGGPTVTRAFRYRIP